MLGAPPLDGLGTAGGFKIVVEDRSNTGLENLQTTADRIVAAGEKDTSLKDLFSSFRAKTPWLYLDIDRTATRDARACRWPRSSTRCRSIWDRCTSTTSTSSAGPGKSTCKPTKIFVGSSNTSNSSRFATNGETWSPSASLATVQRRQRSGHDRALQHVSRGADQRQSGARESARGKRSSKWSGWSSDELPWSMRYEWTELALLQLQTGNTAMLVFLLAVVLVFLVLAAQYESWSLPLAVILVVPMCLLCSVYAVQWGTHGHQHLHPGRFRGVDRIGL